MIDKLKDNNIYNILIYSFIVVFCLFLAFSYSIEQHAVDFGLISSELVKYPDTFNPWRTQLNNSFTFLRYLTEVLFYLNLNIQQISLFLLFLTSLFFSLGIYLTVKNISSSKILALASCLFILIFRKNFGDLDYPTHMFSEHTNGMMALSLTTFLFGLIANKNFFSVGFFIIFLIANHLAVGLWFFSIFSLSLFVLYFYLKAPFNFKSTISGSILGLILLIFLFYIHQGNLLEIPYSYDKETFMTYIQNWDEHRNGYGKLSLLHYSYIFKSFILIFLILIYSKFYKFKNKPQLKVLFLFLCFSIFFSFIIYLTYKKFPSLYPNLAVRVIPTRFFLLHSVIGYAVIISISYLILKNFLKKTNFKEIYSIYFIILLFTYYSVSHYKHVLYLSNQFIFNIKESDTVLEKDTFWKQVKETKTKGFFLTSNQACFKTFRKSKKPILMCPYILNYIPYIPELSVPTKHIVETIFEIPFADPKPKFMGVQDDIMSEKFKTKTKQEWNNLANEFNLSALILPNEWKIALKPKLTGKDYSFYTFED